ncbi:MAG: hypothetical protein AAF962_17060 [Actinomycetota bacterium]
MFPRRRQTDTAIGIELRTDAAYLAFVRIDDHTVVGLGRATYQPGTVVGGAVRRSAAVVEAIDGLLDQVRWPTPPAVAVVAPPVEDAGGDGTVSAPIIDQGPAGTATASARHVDLAVDAIGRTRTATTTVDALPVAAARFAAEAEPSLPVVFARGGGDGAVWLATAGPLGIEIDLDHEDGLDAVITGPDPSRLTPPAWGCVNVVSKVRRAYPHPGRYVPAVGAAFAATGRGPRVNLAGPQAIRRSGQGVEHRWGVEVVR